jgi:hypothetical protein
MIHDWRKTCKKGKGRSQNQTGNTSGQKLGYSVDGRYTSEHVGFLIHRVSQFELPSTSFAYVQVVPTASSYVVRVRDSSEHESMFFVQFCGIDCDASFEQ